VNTAGVKLAAVTDSQSPRISNYKYEIWAALGTVVITYVCM